MPEAAKPVQPEDEKRKRMRSPAYPYVNLETAIKRAKEFYDKEQRNAAALKVAAKHWGYEEKSSGAGQTAAALISFGLMQDEGTGDKRKLKLTDLALRILLDNRTDSQERAQAIRTAALAPKIHKQIWKKWGSTLPSDDNVKHTLMLDWIPPFNPAAVGGFIKEYKDTISFAKPDPSVIVSVGDEELDPEEEDTGSGIKDSDHGYKPKVGDYVQWAPGGVLQFRDPKRITGLSHDGAYAFVEGNGTGLSVEELTLQAKPKGIETPVPALSEKHTMRQDVFSLAEGTVTIQWPTQLSAESIQDLKDWLKIVERKIARSTVEKEQADGDEG
jgi:hypothetical protein